MPKGYNLSIPSNEDVARKIGSDVPFFISGQPAFVTGIGDIIEPKKIDIELNKSQIRFINTKYGKNNKYNTGFEEIWRNKKRQEVNKYLRSTPPEGDECKVCHLVFANHNLEKILNNKNKWTYIL